MTVALAFDLHFGRYHATPWGRHVNEAAIEWPPSPWRVLRALYSAGRTDLAAAVSLDDLDEALATLAAALPVYALPSMAESHTRHFVPSTNHSPRNYKRDMLFDGFAAVGSSRGSGYHEDPSIVVVWDVDLDDDQRSAVASAAQGVGYLGRSESVCSVRLVEDLPTTDSVPLGPDGEVEDGQDVIELLAVDPSAPSGERLAALGTSVPEVRGARLARPAGTRLVPYVRPVPVTASTSSHATRRPRRVAPTVAVLRIVDTARPGLHDALRVSEATRSTLAKRLGDGKRSPTIDGHEEGTRPRRDQHRHAHFLVVSDAGSARCDRIVLWASEGLDDAIVSALAWPMHLHYFRGGSPVRLDVALAALGTASTLDVDGVIAQGPGATTWESATPFVPGRHPKRRGGRIVDTTEDQVRRELGQRGLPDPVAFEEIDGDWARFHHLRRGTRLASPGERSSRAPAVAGMRLTFPELVKGPLALGALCHFGLGTLRPL